MVFSLRLAIVTYSIMLPLYSSLLAAESQETIDALRSWRRSFATLDLSYTATCRNVMEARFPQLKSISDSELHGKWGNYTRWCWADFGGYLDERCRIENGERVSRAIQGGTSKQSFVANAIDGVGSTNQWHNISYSIPSGRVGAWAGVVEPIYSLWVNARGTWIDDVIDLSQPHNDGLKIEWLDPVVYDGRKMTRCLLTWPTATDGRPSREYWFDPAHNHLPVKVFCPIKQPSFHYEVVEFAEIEPGWWFPKRGVMGDSSRSQESWNTWHVLSVVRNKPLTTADFDPPQPSEGTHISMPNGERKRHGALGVPAKEPFSPMQVNPNQTPVVAVPSQSRWGYVLVLSAVALLAIGGWLRWKR